MVPRCWWCWKFQTRMSIEDVDDETGGHASSISQLKPTSPQTMTTTMMRRGIYSPHFFLKTTKASYRIEHVELPPPPPAPLALTLAATSLEVLFLMVSSWNHLHPYLPPPAAAATTSPGCHDQTSSPPPHIHYYVTNSMRT